MGKFSKLLQGKGKTITIGDDKFEIKALTGEHFGLFMEMDGVNKADAIKELVLVSLKQTDSTITLDDINELPLGELTKIMEVITDVNEFR